MFRKRKKNRSLWMALLAIPAMLSSSLIALVFSQANRRRRGSRQAGVGLTPVTGQPRLETPPPALHPGQVETAPIPAYPTGWQVAPAAQPAPPEWRVAPESVQESEREPEPQREEKRAIRRLNRWGFVVLLVPFVLLLAAIIGNVVLAQAQTTPYVVPGANPSAGQALVTSYGCTSCHSIPGVSQADARVGPPLSGFSRRSFIAGELPNNPNNLVQWIMHPQEVKPGTAMPDMGVTLDNARDIAAYLYSLR